MNFRTLIQGTVSQSELLNDQNESINDIHEVSWNQTSILIDQQSKINTLTSSSKESTTKLEAIKNIAEILKLQNKNKSEMIDTQVK